MVLPVCRWRVAGRRRSSALCAFNVVLLPGCRRWLAGRRRSVARRAFIMVLLLGRGLVP